MRALARVTAALLVGLLVACGGGGESTNGTNPAPAPQDARLVLDSMAWDQGDWAD